MDLYQGLVLGFLVLGVLVLMGIFTRLGPIRRSLETSPEQPTAEARPEEVGAGAAATHSSNEPEAEAAAAEPEPVAGGQWELVPIASEEPEQVASEEPEQVASEEPGPEPFFAEEPESEQVASEEPESIDAEESEPEPEEKPFQRDGRWWFRRDDELLVYDEASGEWLPSDAAASPFLIESDHTPATADATSPGLARGTASVATREREDAPEEAAQRFAEGEVTDVLSAPSFWKCVTCGAVNGSTATTCRMCFAARP